MKEKKLCNSLFKVLGSILVLAMVIVVSQSVTAKAADKKVRVNTYDELVAAVNNKSVETIVLKTDIHGTYNISALENAKSKKLIIYAPYVSIVNKAVWESVEIEYVSHFKEAVSGNTIYIKTSALENFEVAKKVSVKKLGLKDFYGYEETRFYYIVRKGGKVKNITYVDYDGKEYKFDKNNLVLNFKGDAFEWSESADVEILFDKNGRIVNVKEMFEYEPSTEYVFK